VGKEDYGFLLMDTLRKLVKEFNIKELKSKKINI